MQCWEDTKYRIPIVLLTTPGAIQVDDVELLSMSHCR